MSQLLPWWGSEFSLVVQEVKDRMFTPGTFLYEIICLGFAGLSLEPLSM
jgi:hypothetical protein